MSSGSIHLGFTQQPSPAFNAFTPSATSLPSSKDGKIGKIVIKNFEEIGSLKRGRLLRQESYGSYFSVDDEGVPSHKRGRFVKGNSGEEDSQHSYFSAGRLVLPEIVEATPLHPRTRNHVRTVTGRADGIGTSTKRELDSQTDGVTLVPSSLEEDAKQSLMDRFEDAQKADSSSLFPYPSASSFEDAQEVYSSPPVYYPAPSPARPFSMNSVELRDILRGRMAFVFKGIYNSTLEYPRLTEHLKATVFQLDKWFATHETASKEEVPAFTDEDINSLKNYSKELNTLNQSYESSIDKIKKLEKQICEVFEVDNVYSAERESFLLKDDDVAKRIGSKSFWNLEIEYVEYPKLFEEIKEKEDLLRSTLSKVYCFLRNTKF